MEINPTPPEEPNDWFSEGQQHQEYENDLPLPPDGYLAPDAAFLPEESPVITREAAIEAFHDDIITDVKEGLSAAIEQLKNGYDKMHDGEAIGELLTDMTREAASRGAVDEVDQYVGEISELPGTEPEALAEACYVGVKVGSTKSFEVLGNLLAKEKAAALEDADDEDVALDQLSASPMLFELMHMCQDENVVPDTWINKYATDSVHRWELYNHYYHDRMEAYDFRNVDTPPYETVAHAPGLDPEADQARFEEIAADLIGNPDISDELIIVHTLKTLVFVKDPAINRGLVEQYHQAITRIDAPAAIKLHNLASIGVHTLRDPELAETYAERLKVSIDEAAEGVVERGGDEYYVNAIQLEWRTLYEQRQNDDPQEFVATLNRHTTNLFDMADTIHGEAEDLRDNVTGRHDKLLYFRAEDVAKNGDFAAAKTYLSAVMNPEERELAMQMVLDHAVTFEDIAAVRPDEMEMDMYPHLAAHFTFTEARLSEDAAPLTAFVEEYERLSIIDARMSDMTEGLIDEARRLLVERGIPQRNIDAEQTAQAASWAQGIGFESVKQQYEIALREERPSERLRAMWLFAQGLPHLYQ